MIARYPAVGVPVDDPGIHIDIDTPADLAAVDGSDRRAPRAAAYDSMF